MMLLKSELKKLLFTQRGALILAVCLLLKLIFLCTFPEMKDQRIRLSQKQYDQYLSRLCGENTDEKSEWILADYEDCVKTINARENTEKQYSAGEISEAEWQSFVEKLDTAYLHQNASKIFAEKAEQFAKQPKELPSAYYIYEYGWQTIYSLQKFPDVFLLVGLLVLAAQCYSMETSSGMLLILFAAKDGRRHLFYAKLLALLFVGAAAAVFSGGLEASVFIMRGWCNDANAPIYSVRCMTECMLPISLAQGYAISLTVRSISSLLFAAVILALSVWIKSTVNLIFTGMCILALPMILDGTAALFTHSGLLCGSKMLLELGQMQLPVFLPMVVVAGYSFIATFIAERITKVFDGFHII